MSINPSAQFNEYVRDLYTLNHDRVVFLRDEKNQGFSEIQPDEPLYIPENCGAYAKAVFAFGKAVEGKVKILSRISESWEGRKIIGLVVEGKPLLKLLNPRPTLVDETLNSIEEFEPAPPDADEYSISFGC
jgi:hypothetical protein